jgi:histidinol dehydrogenase
MAIRLDVRQSDFEAAFGAFLSTKREVSEDVDNAARAIIADVRQRGDKALID